MARDGTGVGGGPRLQARADASVAAAVDAMDPGAARASGENFPVALRLLPTRRRRYLMAVYGFARTTDDIGDRAPREQRMGLLDELEADLRRLYASQAGDGARVSDGAGASDGAGVSQGGDGTGTQGGDGAGARTRVVQTLAPAVADCGIPIQPFLDLIQANRQDQEITRYQTFADLLDYCRLSANPVGRIVLHIFDSFSERQAELSDSICTALQLAEHWQDVAEDLRAGRIYLPGQDMDEFGCSEQDLSQASAPPQVRALIAAQAGRAKVMLEAGAPLIATLHGAARVAVAGYVAGGRAALAAIAAADHDVLRATPRPGKRRLAAELILAYARGR